MKKTLLLLMLAMLSNLAAWSAEVNQAKIGGIWYVLQNNIYGETNFHYTAQVIPPPEGEPKYSGDIELPPYVSYNSRTYDVTGIDGFAFQDCTGLTSIKFPNLMTHIGQEAFDGCTGLTSIEIASDINSLGAYAFKGCTSLTSLSIWGNQTTIGLGAFEGCTNLSTVTITGSIKQIKGSAFDGCNKISKVIIGASGHVYLAEWCSIDFTNAASNPLSIAKHLYSDENTEITNLSIPNSVTNIKQYAFYGCTGITSLSLGTAVSTIGNYAFYKCSGLTSLSLGSTVSTIGSYAFNGCSNIETLTIPNSVTNIYQYAFQGCSGITSLTLGNSVSIIGSSAFAGCSSLQSLTIPNSVTSVGNSAFACSNLKTMTFNCATIGDWGMRALTTITIGEAVNSISSDAFKNCANISTITVNSNNNTYNSPNNCNAIIEKSSNTLIRGCANTVIPNTVTVIGDYAFSNCGSMTSITIPSSVTSIGEEAFYNCTSISSINIPDGVTTIGAWAFSNSGLTSIIIPSSVTTIGDRAFNNCFDLMVVRALGTTPASIGESTFPYTLASLVVPPSCKTSYENDSYWSRFSTICEPIAFEDAAMKTFCVQKFDTSGDGELDLFEAAAYVQGMPSIPYDVTKFNEFQYFTGVSEIRNGSFYNHTSLEEITIPENVATIYNSAFYGCSGLKSVSFSPNSQLSTIGNQAFMNCSSLNTFIIPNSVTSLGTQAFSGCTSLESVTISDNLASIGSNTFNGCTSLTSLTIPVGITSIDWRAFSGCDNLSSLTVAAGNSKFDSRDNCNAIIEIANNTLYLGCKGSSIPSTVVAIGSNSFNSVPLTGITIPANVNTIEMGAFANCKNLSSIVIPSSVTTIGSSVFYGCENLNSVILEEGVTTINGGAFTDCTSLTSLTIPFSVTTIGSNAFNGCSNLTSLYVPYTKYFSGTGVNSQVIKPYVIPQTQFTTFACTRKVDFSGVDGLTAFVANSYNNGELTMESVENAKEGEGILLRVDDPDNISKPFYLAYASTTPASRTNMLKGVTTATTIGEIDGSYTNFILTKGNDNSIGFYKTSGGNIAAGKAYLQLPTADVASARGIKISFEDGELSGIAEVSKNGAASEAIYNLNGQRITNGMRQGGLYIVNGKKVYVK